MGPNEFDVLVPGGPNGPQNLVGSIWTPWCLCWENGTTNNKE